MRVRHVFVKMLLFSFLGSTAFLELGALSSDEQVPLSRILWSGTRVHAKAQRKNTKLPTNGQKLHQHNKKDRIITRESLPTDVGLFPL